MKNENLCRRVDITSFLVIEILRDWIGHGDGGQWYRYKGLQEALKEKGMEVSIKKLKKVMKELLTMKAVTFDWTVNGDGQINGKGYFLTPQFERELLEVER